MARQPRKTQKTTVFSIKQSAEVPIFRDKSDRSVFVDILESSKEKCGFDLYGYCLLDEDSFWLIINAKNRSIASIMQSISISYALYRDDVKQLFKRRYKSEPIYDTDALNETMETLMSDPRYETCVYCFYDPIQNTPYPFITDVSDDLKIEQKYSEKIDMDTLSQYIESHVQEVYGSLDILSDVNIRNDVIKHVYTYLNVTQTQISKYFEISNSLVSKILST